MKGSQTQSSNTSTYTSSHEGYSGWWAQHFISGFPNGGPRAIATTVEVEEPDVILMHLGSNDLNGTGPASAASVEQTLDNIRQVINKINSQADSTNLARPTILLAKPIPWLGISADNPDIKSDIETLGSRISDAIENGFPASIGNPTRQPFLSNVFEVDGHTGFKPGFMQTDGIHPNAEGERFLASAFFQGMVDAGICEVTTPAQTTLVSPSKTATSNPAYTWSAVSNSSRYYLWARDSGGIPIRKWYTAAEANCADGTGTCTVNPSLSVTGQVTWYVRTWSNQGYGPWSSPLMFSTQGIPNRPELISPQGNNANAAPIYTWQAVAGATWYHLWVKDSTGTPVTTWYEANGAELSCNQSTCTVNPNIAINGNATWWVRPWNFAGNGPWSTGMAFTP